MKRLKFACLVFPALTFAATQGEDWQKGKITDFSTTQLENTNAAPGGSLPMPMVDTQVLVIRSGDRIYVAQEKHAWHNACLFIEGDDVKYVVENHQLRLMDTAGTVCRFDLVREGKAE